MGDGNSGGVECLSKFSALLWSVTPKWVPVNVFGSYCSFNVVFANLFQLAEECDANCFRWGSCSWKASAAARLTHVIHTHTPISFPLPPPCHPLVSPFGQQSTALSIRHRTKGNFNCGFLRFFSCLILWLVTIVRGLYSKYPLQLLEFIVQQLHLNLPANFV